MADSKAPLGVAVPTQQAIDIMNQNAAAAAKRSTYATLVSNQYQVGRDTLRRDYSVKAPTDLPPGLQAVPKDSVPTSPDSGVNSLVSNLVNQFKGTGGDGNARASGSGGGGRGSGSSGGPGSPVLPGSGGQQHVGEVQTFTNPNAKPGEVIKPAKETRNVYIGDPNPGHGWHQVKVVRTGDGIGQGYAVWEKD